MTAEERRVLAMRPANDDRPRVDLLRLECFAVRRANTFEHVAHTLQAITSALASLLPPVIQNDAQLRMWIASCGKTEPPAGVRYGGDSMHIDGAWPFSTVSFYGLLPRPLPGRGGELSSVSVAVDASLFFGASPSISLVDLVAALCEAWSPFYCAGTLAQQMILRDGRPYGALGSYAPHDRFIDGEGWLGLPWRAVRAEWFGLSYPPLIGDALTARGRRVGSGLFVEGLTTEERLDLLPVGLLTTSPEGGVAAVMPPGLRFPPPGGSGDLASRGTSE